MMSMSSSSSSSSSRSSSSSSTIIPRAAVSVVVRSPAATAIAATTPSFILIQRGQEPNKGLWSLPGGKLEAGETTLQGGQRELQEECQLFQQQLHWYTGGAFCVTDSIHYSSSSTNNTKDSNDDNEQKQVLAFHYVIAQCFATAPSQLPLIPSDDAADADWFTMDQVQDKIDTGDATPGVIQVLQRAEQLYQAGMLL